MFISMQYLQCSMCDEQKRWFHLDFECLVFRNYSLGRLHSLLVACMRFRRKITTTRHFAVIVVVVVVVAYKRNGFVSVYQLQVPIDWINQ